MIWVGLTGGIGSGKSTVSKILREMAYPVVDADLLAREVVVKGSEGFDLVVKTFGQGIVGANGEIDRQQLGRLVFADPERLAKLESIVHPLVRSAANVKRREFENQGEDIAFYDVPLLFEKNMSSLFDKTVLVYCDEETQKERLKNRESWSDQEIQDRLKNQMSIEDKKKIADVVIDNSGLLADLRHQVVTAVDKITNPKNNQTSQKQ